VYDEAVVWSALVTAEEEVTAVEASGRTVACCAAVTVVMVEEVPATCEMEDIHGQGFGHRGAFRPVPYQAEPCPGAFRCLVDDGASGRVGAVYAVVSLVMGPCCSVG
jgi:hypothetical protein